MQTPPAGIVRKPGITQKARNAASDHLHHQAFNNSLLANIITNGKDGKIINANQAACRLLGYSGKELPGLYQKDIFDMSESRFKKMGIQINSEGHAKADITAIKKNGKQLPCQVTSVIFTGANSNTHSIITIVDMSQTVLKQKKIDVKKEKLVSTNIVLAQTKSDVREAESKQCLKYMSITSYDAMLDWDIPSNDFYIGGSYEETFGYKIPNNIIPFNDWIQCIHPDEKDAFEKNLIKALESRKKKWAATFRIIRQDGSIADVASRGIIVRDAGGKAIRLIGALQDVTWQTEMEEKLRYEINSKQIQIADAVADAHEQERSDIGRELHDNVNQLLVASGMYLGMARNKDMDSETCLGRAYTYTKDAIEVIRKLTKRLVTDIIKEFGLSDAIAKISKSTMELNHVKITCTMGNFTENKMKNKFKLSIFRIIQEQFNNIIKYAGASTVKVVFSQTKNVITLSITDDGAGFDTNQKQEGIGINNIKSRAAFYKGSAEFVSQPGQGCSLMVTLPVTAALLID